MTAVFRWPIRVYYEDTDLSGVVYHANYLRFFERARTEWLRSRGQTHETLAREHGAVFTVVDLSIRYAAPARIDDALEATVAVVTSGRASLIFEQTLVAVQNPAKPLATARVRVACVDASSFKPRAWPAGWLDP